MLSRGFFRLLFQRGYFLTRHHCLITDTVGVTETVWWLGVGGTFEPRNYTRHIDVFFIEKVYLLFVCLAENGAGGFVSRDCR